MAGGLHYETGRDMPPGMAEKIAVQIARRMQAEENAKRQQGDEGAKGQEPGGDM